jgi:hypothetical protein
MRPRPPNKISTLILTGLMQPRLELKKKGAGSRPYVLNSHYPRLCVCQTSCSRKIAADLSPCRSRTAIHFAASAPRLRFAGVLVFLSSYVGSPTSPTDRRPAAAALPTATSLPRARPYLRVACSPADLPLSPASFPLLLWPPLTSSPLSCQSSLEILSDPRRCTRSSRSRRIIRPHQILPWHHLIKLGETHASRGWRVRSWSTTASAFPTISESPTIFSARSNPKLKLAYAKR